MPRLSVDVDLAYLLVDEPRNTALKEISAALDRIAIAIKKAIVGTRMQETRARNPDRITRLTVAVGPTRIKIEPNEVIRGSVFPAQERELTRRAEDTFELSVTAQTLSLADLYGGLEGARFCGRDQLAPLTNEADQLMAIFVTIVRKTKAGMAKRKF